MSEYVTYILYSQRHNKFYRGYTSNLIERFKSHNELSNKGFTVNFRPWKVVYIEFCNSKREAKTREKFLKSGLGREWVEDKLVY
jgi:putative endonuclease